MVYRVRNLLVRGLAGAAAGVMMFALLPQARGDCAHARSHWPDERLTAASELVYLESQVSPVEDALKHRTVEERRGPAQPVPCLRCNGGKHGTPVPPVPPTTQSDLLQGPALGPASASWKALDIGPGDPYRLLLDQSIDPPPREAPANY